MARFIPELNPANDPNWLGQSRSINPGPPTVDKTLGSALSGVGDVIGAVAKGTDTAIKQGIEDDLYSAIDRIRNEHGSDLAPAEVPAIAGTGAKTRQFEAGVLGEGAPALSVPADAKQSISGLSRMKAAYEAGHLSNSYYYAQLEAVASQMRNKYPGYRSEIDQMISGITGVNPANSLRSSLLSDLAASEAQSSSNTNKLLTMWRQDQEYLGPVPFDDYSKNFGKYQSTVASKKAAEHSVAARTSELTVMDKEDSRAKSLADKGFNEEAQNYVSNAIDKTIRILRTQAISLKEKGATSEEWGTFVQHATSMKLEMENALRQKATRPFPSRSDYTDDMTPAPSDKSYSSFLTGEQINTSIKNALAPVDAIIESIGGKNTDLASSAANMVKHQTDQDYLRITQKYPSLRAYPAIQKMVGQQAMTDVIQQTKGAIYDDLTRAVADTALWNVANPDAGPAPSVSDILDGVDKTSSSQPGKDKVSVIRALKSMAVATKNPELAERAVKSLYGDPHFFANVSAEDKSRIYRMLGSPETTAAIKSAGPAAYQIYTTWMERNFPVVFKQGIDDLVSAASYRPVQSIELNPNTFQFSATSRPEYLPSGAKAFLGGDPAQEYMSKINEGLQLIAPVLKDKYGDQAPSKLMSYLEASGYNPNQPQRGGLLAEMARAIQKHLPEGIKLPGGAEVAPTKLNQPEKRSETDVGSTVTQIASNFVGLDRGSPALTSFVKKATGKDITTQAYCADFANAVLSSAGQEGTGSSAARSFLDYGSATEKPKQGDVVVLWRGSPSSSMGHVGFFDGFASHDGQKYVRMLSGNASGGAVTVQEYPASRVIGYRSVKAKDVANWKFDFTDQTTQVAGDIVPLPITPGPNAGPQVGKEITIEQLRDLHNSGKLKLHPKILQILNKG